MLDLFTVIWGVMTESFLEVTLPSLMQPQNIPAAKDLLHSYNFYASEESKARISRSELYRELCREVFVNWLPLQRGPWETTSNTLHQLKLSAKDDCYVLIMTPDNAVGNGSLLNMARLCDGKRNPILFGFPRVNETGWQITRSLFKEKREVSNRELVSLAMKYIEQAIYSIGVVMQHWILSNNTWMVGHNVPTPCLKPDDEIIRIFSTNTTLNSGYDHALPYIMVEKGYPWYLIGNSDTFFLLERGRHTIQEGVVDSARWQTDKALKGLRFFDQQHQVWQGV